MKFKCDVCHIEDRPVYDCKRLDCPGIIARERVGLADGLTPPEFYRKLSAGERCRCNNEWADGVGGYWCCQHVIHAISAPTYAPDVDPNRPGCQTAPPLMSDDMKEILAWKKKAHAEHMRKLDEIVELLKDISTGLA